MATYNCINSTSNAYGSGGYGTCTSQIGAPNTGFFEQVTGGDGVALVALFAVTLVLGVVAIIARRKAAKTRQSP